MRICDRNVNDFVWSNCRWQALSFGLIVAGRHSTKILYGGVGLRPSRALLLAFKCDAPTVAVDVDFEDRCVMDKTVHRGKRHGGIWKNLAPGPEWLIGGDQSGTAFVASADQFE